MEELPFDTFRIKSLEEAGLRKIPPDLEDYYWSRRQVELLGFVIQKPTTIVDLIQECYTKNLPGAVINQQTCYAVRVEERHDSYGFRVSLC